MAQTATPDKSFIAITINLSQTGSSVRKTIKFLNRKGKFEYSPTCNSCQYQGKVQDNLGYGVTTSTCDRDIEKKGTWRHYTISYKAPQGCKFFKAKADADG